jgi:predicted secreted hydrolase
VTGDAWLDHEWSTSYLAPEASGWDWAGINLDDGGALMLYRLRAKSGGDYYAGGTLLTSDGTCLVFAPEEVAFEVLRTWRSPSTGAEYPVSLRLRAAELEWLLEPLMDDQEFDGRATTQTVYWEGAIRALQGGAEVGRGHLELTGYYRPLGF